MNTKRQVICRTCRASREGVLRLNRGLDVCNLVVAEVVNVTIGDDAQINIASRAKIIEHTSCDGIADQQLGFLELVSERVSADLSFMFILCKN